jgi:hypothetical protein
MSVSRIAEYVLLCTVLLAPMTPLLLRIAGDLAAPERKTAKKAG